MKSTRLHVLLLLGVASFACGDITGPAAPPPTIQLSASSLTLLIGNSETVTATVTASNGSSLDGVIWTSLDDEVVVVDAATGAITAVGAGTAEVEAAWLSSTVTPVRVTVTVPEPLGVVVPDEESVHGDPAREFAVYASPGAVSSPMTLSMRPLSDDDVPAATGALTAIPGTAFEMGPSGTAFDEPIVMVVPFDPGSLPEGTDGQTLFLAVADEGGWRLLSGVVDTAAGRVAARVPHFSKFQIMAVTKGDGSFRVSPAAPHTFFPAGGDMTFEASYLDPAGNEVPDVTLVWSFVDRGRSYDSCVEFGYYPLVCDIRNLYVRIGRRWELAGSRIQQDHHRMQIAATFESAEEASGLSEEVLGSVHFDFHRVDRPEVSVTHPAGTGTKLPAGQSSEFRAELVNATEVAWILNGAEIGRGSPASLVLPAGTHTIRAEGRVLYKGSVIATAFEEVTVAAFDPPVVSVDEPAAGAEVWEGRSVQFTATATTAAGAPLDASAVQWWSDQLTASFGSGASFSYDGLPVGEHSISVTATDNVTTRSDARAFSVLKRPLMSIAAPTGGHAAPELRPITFRAADGAGASISPDMISWSSSRDGALESAAGKLEFTTSELSIGTHVITVTVLGPQGETATASVSVQVTANTSPKPRLQIGKGPHYEGQNLDVTVSATDAEDEDEPTLALTWSYEGEGKPSAPTLSGGTHTYRFVNPVAGLYTVTLTATDSHGATGTTTISFEVRKIPPLTVAIQDPAKAVWQKGETLTLLGTVSNAVTGSEVVYFWESSIDGYLGGTTLEGGQATLKTSKLSPGTHTIRFGAASSEGQYSTASRTIRVNAPPTVAITSPTAMTVSAGQSITFTALAEDAEDDASPSDAKAVTYQWREGTTVLSTAATFSRTFDAGEHTVLVTVTDSDGARDRASVTLTAIEPDPPEATITGPATDTVIQLGDAVALEGSGVAKPGASLVSLVWTSDLQAGTLATGAEPDPVTLTVPGTHTITLTATDDFGSTGTDTREVYANEAPSGVSIDVSPAGGSYEEGAELTLTAAASDDEALTYAWSAGVTSLGAGSSITWTPPVGSHTVQVEVSDGMGGVTSATADIEVAAAPAENQPPVATITSPADGSSVFAGQPLTLEGTGIDPDEGALSGTSLAWSSSIDGPLGFGTSVALTGMELSPGTHTITLLAIDAYIESDQAEITLEVIVPEAVVALAGELGEPSTVTVVGSPVSLLLQVISPAPPPGPVSGIQVQVTWDPTLLTLSDALSSTATLDASSAASGSLVVTLADFITDPILAELLFEPLALGETLIEVTILSAEDPVDPSLDISHLIEGVGHPVTISTF